jgi:hypothetical protein
MTNLKPILKEIWKRMPGASIYYYLQGEFKDNPQDLLPAAGHVTYASVAIGLLSYTLTSKIDFQTSQQENPNAKTIERRIEDLR